MQITPLGQTDFYKVGHHPMFVDGTKKSAKGLLQVHNTRSDSAENDLLFDGLDNIKLKDQMTKFEEATGLLQTVFENGFAVNKSTLDQIRKRLKGQAI